MEVILLENIAKLGDLGDKVTVKSGYGRNYLIPQKKAAPATIDNLANFETRRAELQATADEKLRVAQIRAAEVAALDVRVYAKAGDEGKLFGSITVRDITAAIAERGVEVEKSEVRLPDGPLRELGDYEIQIHLHPEVNAVLSLSVTAEE
ncbi:MAG: 50S ribosomal protein L9 [Gammaproteobacteria bacterium]|jgi:large subunit ribosomal protein L9|nr:50S ribosomal protein L9 [Gammaproteobacteria bacterium]